MNNTTIITIIRNRNSIFVHTLPNWLQFDIPIIIVDWRDDGCERAYDVVRNHLGKIRLIETQYEYMFHKELALNLAISQVKTDNFIVLDVDYILDRNFFEMNVLGDNEVITAHGQGSLSGLMYCKKQYADAIGRYNENLPYWGFADTDFFVRLRDNGISSRRAVGAEHRPHPVEMSIENQFKWCKRKGCNVEHIKRTTWHANRDIAKLIVWDASIPHVQWDLKEIAPSVFLAVRKFIKE